jgi:NADH-quinone oxidoreductase subunit H
MDSFELLITSLKIIVIFVTVVHVVPIMIWVERKGAALIQDRPGPNRVGIFGLLQPVADALKFIFKEDPIPDSVNKFLYCMGPFLSLMPATLVIAAIPMGDFFQIGDKAYKIQVADLDVGVLYMLAIGSLGIYGILFGGWASNNKFSLVGSLRAASQMVSYEVPLGLAAVGAVLVFGSFSLREMTQMQEGLIFGFLPNWGVFYQPVGFLLFFISAFAETNRLPFDLPETEAELVAGFHTEYGSMKFATYFMAEYMNMASISGLMTCLYFGGWKLPWISDATLLSLVGSQNILAAIQFATFIGKVSVFMLIFVWVRWTVPRFRYDQLMTLAWKNLIPIGLINLLVTAVIMYFGIRP